MKPLARGSTVLENAAQEPEVKDLSDLLVKMGARIEGAGTSMIRIEGVERLGGADHTIIGDRIEAGTFLIAGTITRGDLVVTDCPVEHLGALIAKLRPQLDYDAIFASKLRNRKVVLGYTFRGDPGKIGILPAPVFTEADLRGHKPGLLESSNHFLKIPLH